MRGPTLGVYFKEAVSVKEKFNVPQLQPTLCKAKIFKLFRAMCMIKLSRTFGKKGWSLKRPWLLIGAELFISFGKAQS